MPLAGRSRSVVFAVRYVEGGADRLREKAVRVCGRQLWRVGPVSTPILGDFGQTMGKETLDVANPRSRPTAPSRPASMGAEYRVELSHAGHGCAEPVCGEHQIPLDALGRDGSQLEPGIPRLRDRIEPIEALKALRRRGQTIEQKPPAEVPLTGWQDTSSPNREFLCRSRFRRTWSTSRDTGYRHRCLLSTRTATTPAAPARSTSRTHWSC